MEMTDVESTNIAQVGFNKDTREMRVVFKRGGATYIIYGIEPEVYDAFVHATSPGSFYAKNIRGAYRYAKIEAEGEKA